MNFREGMRRLGILLGSCGAIAGGVLGYSGVQAVLSARNSYHKFESFMTLPTMQRIVKGRMSIPVTASKFGTNPQNETNSPKYRITTETGVYVLEVPAKEKTGPWDQFIVDAPDVVGDGEGGGYLFQSNPFLKGNPDGIKKVHLAASRLVSSIELSSGEVVQRAEPISLIRCLSPLLYPLFGFFLPWSAVRVLTWVGSGFFVRPR